MPGNSRDDPQVRQETPAALPAYGNAPQQQTFPVGMPGELNTLGNQLAQGFAPNAEARPSFFEMLNSIYRPMSVMNYREPISTTKGNLAGGKYAPVSTGNPTLDAMLNPAKRATTGTGSPVTPPRRQPPSHTGPARLPGWDNR